MTWDKPKNFGHWLLLLIPAGICVLATVAGGVFEPQDGNWMGWALVGLVIAAVTSLAQSIWLARVNPTPSGKIGVALLCFVLLMVVNCAVSFAGCAVGGSFLPGMNFH